MGVYNWILRGKSVSLAAQANQKHILSVPLSPFYIRKKVWFRLGIWKDTGSCCNFFSLLITTVVKKCITVEKFGSELPASVMSKLVYKGELNILKGVPTQTFRSSSRATQEERKNWHQLKAFCLPNERKENIAAVKLNISVRVGAGHKYGISNLAWVRLWRWLLFEDPRLRRYGFISRLSVVSVIWRIGVVFFFLLFVVAWLACCFTTTIRVHWPQRDSV